MNPPARPTASGGGRGRGRSGHTAGRRPGRPQADLVALVEECRPGQREQQHRRGAHRCSSPMRIPTRPKSWFESIHAAPARPAPRLDRGSRARRLPGRVQQLEDEGRVEMLEVGLPSSRSAGRPRRRGTRPPPPRGSRASASPMPGASCASGGGRARPRRAAAGTRTARSRGGSSRSSGSFSEPVDRVDAEPVDAALDPEADDVLHRRDHLGIAPVEVGLLGIERVQVPARRARVPRPRRPAERRPQLFGRRSGPDVPVRVLAKPRVLDRRVARRRGRAAARSPRSCAAVASASNSSSVPRRGSTPRESATSYPKSAIGDG